MAGAGVTVARPGSRVLVRPGGRDVVPHVPGWCRLLVTRWLWGAAWLVALTTRSSGRVRVTPSRRRALWPWTRRPIKVAPAWCLDRAVNAALRVLIRSRRTRRRASAPGPPPAAAGGTSQADQPGTAPQMRGHRVQHHLALRRDPQPRPVATPDGPATGLTPRHTRSFVAVTPRRSETPPPNRPRPTKHINS